MNDDIQRLIPSTTLYRRKDKLLSQENTRSKMPQTPTINSLRAPGVIIGSDASKGAATTPFKGGYPQLSPSTPVGRTLKELNRAEDNCISIQSSATPQHQAVCLKLRNEGGGNRSALSNSKSDKGL